MSFHEKYVENSAAQLPPNLRGWNDLDDTYRISNLEQANYSIEILKSVGFGRRRKRCPSILKFTKKDTGKIEQMAQMEHGRWIVERLRDGWRHGKTRDNAQKIHDCLVPWGDLPDSKKIYDRNAVRAFPEILAKAGFEIYRLDSSAKDD